MRRTLLRVVVFSLLLISGCRICHAQAVQYRDGAWYSARKCSNPRCSMCAEIDSQRAYARQIGATRLSWAQWTARNTVQPVTAGYRTETRTARVQVGTRKRCVNGVCYFEPIYENRTTTVRIPIAKPSAKPATPEPTNASHQDTIDTALELLKLTPNDVFCDVGCGSDARVLIAAVEGYGCTAVGVEIDKATATKARQAVLQAVKAGRIPAGSITIVTTDAATFSPEEYGITVAFAYLFPETLTAVSDSLRGIPRLATAMHAIPGEDYARREDDVYLYDFRKRRQVPVTVRKPATRRNSGFRVVN